MSHHLNHHHSHNQKEEGNGHGEEDSSVVVSLNARSRVPYQGPLWRSVLRPAPRSAESRHRRGMECRFDALDDRLNETSRVTGDPNSQDAVDGRVNAEAAVISVSDTRVNVFNKQLNGPSRFTGESSFQAPVDAPNNAEATGVSNSDISMPFDLQNQLLQTNLDSQIPPIDVDDTGLPTTDAISTDIENGSISDSIHNQPDAGSVASEATTRLNNLSDTATRLNSNYLSEVEARLNINMSEAAATLNSFSGTTTRVNNDMPEAATRLNNLTSMPLLMRLLSRDGNSSLHLQSHGSGDHTTPLFSPDQGHNAEAQAEDYVPSNVSQEVNGAGLASISRLVRRSHLHWRRARRRFLPLGSLQSHDGHVSLRNVLNFSHSQDLRLHLNGVLQSLDGAVSSASQDGGFSNGHALNRETSRVNAFSGGTPLNRDIIRSMSIGSNGFSAHIGDTSREISVRQNVSTNIDSTSSDVSANLNQEVCKDVDSGCKSANFECNICLDMASDPVVTCCGHIYCWPCLYNWLHVHSVMKECPVCKGHLPDSAIIPIYGRGNNTTESCDRIPPRPQGHSVRGETNNLFAGENRVNFGSLRNDSTNSNSNISSLVMERLRIAQRLHQEFFNRRSIRIGQRMRRPIASAANLSEHRVSEQRPRSNIETGLDNLAAHLDGLQANMQRVLELVSSIPIQSASSSAMEPLNGEASNVRPSSLDMLTQLRSVVGQLIEGTTQSQRESPGAAEGGASGSTDVELGPSHARKRRRLN